MTDQLNLFGAKELAPINPVAHDSRLRALASRLPDSLYLGTSSWAFPGWNGIVYQAGSDRVDRKNYQTLLSRHGLLAYSQHPLLRSVGIDRSYYGPMAASEFARYAELVPDDFRFLVKAHELVSRAEVLDRAGQNMDNDLFLSSDYAREEILQPAIEGLADKCGVVLFQFPPQSTRALGAPDVFVERLQRFVDSLPDGPHYAVELRNVELFDARYARALTDVGATHCYNVHPKMPTIADQLGETGTPDSDYVVVRWMLQRDRTYEEAKDAFKPFDHIASADAPTRQAIAGLCQETTTKGHRAFVIVNNKAEGCAPLSLVKLAEEMVGL